MGRTKEVYMDLEESNDIIDRLLLTLRDGAFYESCEDDEIIDDVIRHLYELRELLSHCENSSDLSLSNNLSKIIIGKVKNLYNQICQIPHSGISDNEKNKIRRVLYELNIVLKTIMSNCNRDTSDYNKAYNSTKYYEERIQAIEEEKRKLESKVKQLYNEKVKSEKQQAELEENRLQLNNAINQISIYQKELDLRKKQDDASDEWKKRIETTFDKLKEYLTPIENEHKRLSEMFFSYRVLSVFILFFFVVLEVVACYKISNSDTFPEFKNYIVLFLPVPVAGCLLWAFICQMNRAQRQMVVLSQYIHEVKYVEGLLLSINSLSPNIDDAVKRINYALDRMIYNHLNIKIENVFSEDNIIKEEKKDSMPYEEALKLIRDVKNIVSK